jgi:hypothetical protein
MGSIVKFCVGFLLLVASADGAYRGMRPQDLQTIQRSQCAVIQPWAAWCSLCLEELPERLPRLAKLKGVEVAVVDLSTPGVREEFSKKWSVIQNAPLDTYFLSDGFTVERFKRLVSRRWDGSLPFAVLVRQGKVTREWMGKVDTDLFMQQVNKLCR